MEKRIITQQPTEENPILVQNYPYGYLKCQIRYWIENKKNKGDKFVSQTQNPKTLVWNKPNRKSTYSPVVIVYENLENNHIECRALSRYVSYEDYNEFMEFAKGVEFNEIQRDWLKGIRAYLKAYENVTFKMVNTTAFSDEERKEFENKQNNIKAHLQNDISKNYMEDLD